MTAGIDFGLTVASILYGEETAKIIQLLLEYDPAPPFDAGSPEKAGPKLVLRQFYFEGKIPTGFSPHFLLDRVLVEKAISMMQQISSLELAKPVSCHDRSLFLIH